MPWLRHRSVVVGVVRAAVAAAVVVDIAPDPDPEPEPEPVVPVVELLVLVPVDVLVDVLVCVLVELVAQWCAISPKQSSQPAGTMSVTSLARIQPLFCSNRAMHSPHLVSVSVRLKNATK